MEVRVVDFDSWRGDHAFDVPDDAFKKFTAAGNDELCDFLFDVSVAPDGTKSSAFENFGNGDDVSNVYWLHVRDVLLLDR